MNFGESPAHKRENTRENLQNLFDRAFLSGNNSDLRENYKALRNIELTKFTETANERISISTLAENLTIACDILTTDTGVNFIFCGNDTSPVYHNGKALTKAILNLLSNAYLHGCGRLVTVKSIEMNNYIKIEVKNEGEFYCEQYGKGLSFVNRVCNLFDGVFFIERDLFSTTAVMLVKKVPATNCKEFFVPDFYEYLNDRLSPVYVELFGMEYR